MDVLETSTDDAEREVKPLLVPVGPFEGLRGRELEEGREALEDEVEAVDKVVHKEGEGVLDYWDEFESVLHDGDQDLEEDVPRPSPLPDCGDESHLPGHDLHTFRPSKWSDGGKSLRCPRPHPPRCLPRTRCEAKSFF